MSLRACHFGFILISIVGADLFGIWAFRDYARNGNVLNLVLGIVAVLGGLGLIFYIVRLLKKFDSAHIR